MTHPAIPILAQADVDIAPAQAPPPTVEVAPPFWQVLLDNGLALTILLIFVVAIVSVIVNQRRRDKCLNFFDGYRVASVSLAGRVIWGDLVVFAKGLELVFDRPHTTHLGVVKSSAMLYPPEVEGLLCIARTVDGLTDAERARRQSQIDRTFSPNLFRRFLRFCRNTVATLRDAFSKTFSLVLGAVTKQFQPGGVLAQQQGSVNTIGDTLLVAAGNAYEPILERHIGRPVVLQLATPGIGENAFVELPGYLADYSAAYVALFNTAHDPVEEFTLDAPAPGGEPVARDGVTLQRGDAAIVVKATGPELLVVKSATLAGPGETLELNATLVPGASLELRHAGRPVTLSLERTRRVDLVAPRTKATVYFGGDDPKVKPSRPTGVAPEQDIEVASQQEA
ncbi:MAG: hypothetical protein AAGK09_13195 [Planctomycetota bacterium]